MLVLVLQRGRVGLKFENKKRFTLLKSSVTQCDTSTLLDISFVINFGPNLNLKEKIQFSTGVFPFPEKANDTQSFFDYCFHRQHSICKSLIDKRTSVLIHASYL